MNAINRNLTCLAAALAISCLLSATASAHPLPGRDLLKFRQEAMIQTQIMGQVYEGHDELSTAYAPTGIVPTQYRGTFMADDFADTLSTPVVHVRWWGSYMNGSLQFGQVQKFLIAFESDVPNPNPLGFSYPDPAGPVHSQIVTLTTNPLTPQSGLFTENKIHTGSVGVVEDLYEYNAELAVPFPQQANTVHWLKIVALVDHAPGIQPGTPGAPVTEWGWHNRDYTQPNTSLYLAGPPQVSPGETQQGNAALGPIYHFQDDSVQGTINVNTFTNTAGVQQVLPQPNGVVQFLPTFQPQNYIDNIDGLPGIGLFSKDLAFELYTTQVPEPASLALMAVGFAGAVACGRRMRKA